MLPPLYKQTAYRTPGPLPCLERTPILTIADKSRVAVALEVLAMDWYFAAFILHFMSRFGGCNRLKKSCILGSSPKFGKRHWVSALKGHPDLAQGEALRYVPSKK